jgi:hypothetical protein
MRRDFYRHVVGARANLPAANIFRLALKQR